MTQKDYSNLLKLLQFLKASFAGARIGNLSVDELTASLETVLREHRPN